MSFYPAQDQVDRHSVFQPEPSGEDRRLVRSVMEASRLLGISRAHGYRLISRGELRAIRLGRRILVPDIAIRDLLQEGVSPETIN